MLSAALAGWSFLYATRVIHNPMSGPMPRPLLFSVSLRIAGGLG